MSAIRIHYLKPTFTATEVAEWLNENISPGSSEAYTVSVTARRANYKSDDSISWRIEVFGYPPTITITLSPEYSDRFTQKFPHGESTTTPAPAVATKYQEAVPPKVNAHATEILSGSLTAAERDLFQRLQGGGGALSGPAPASTTKEFDTGPTAMLERDETGFCSTFTEYLCLKRVGTDEWHLGAYQYNCVSGEDIPQEILFPGFVPEDEDDEPDWDDIELPIVWQGHNITEMIDDGFLTDELVSMDKGVKFGKASLRDALKYCRSKKWHKEEDFEDAWLELMRTVAVRLSTSRKLGPWMAEVFWANYALGGPRCARASSVRVRSSTR